MLDFRGALIEDIVDFSVIGKGIASDGLPFDPRKDDPFGIDCLLNFSKLLVAYLPADDSINVSNTNMLDVGNLRPLFNVKNRPFLDNSLVLDSQLLEHLDQLFHFYYQT